MELNAQSLKGTATVVQIPPSYNPMIRELLAIGGQWQVLVDYYEQVVAGVADDAQRQELAKALAAVEQELQQALSTLEKLGGRRQGATLVAFEAGRKRLSDSRS